MSIAPPQFVEEFSASMPAAYRKSATPAQIALHAGIVAERGQRRDSRRVVQRGDKRRELALCIAADDRPGLLAMIAAAFVMTEFDVVRAEAYTRVRQHLHAEAVDLFWVREVPGRIGSAEPAPETVVKARLGALEATLDSLLAADVDLVSIVRGADAPPGGAPQTNRVKFVGGQSGNLAVLEIETGDRVGLLFSLAEALHGQHVNIVSAEVRTQVGKVLDRFTISEIGGAPIGSARRLEIQVAVLQAIEPTGCMRFE